MICADTMSASLASLLAAAVPNQILDGLFLMFDDSHCES